MAYFMKLIARLRRDERGGAATEYLVILSILAAGVAGAVALFGQGLDTAVEGWTAFLGPDGPSRS